MNRKSADYVFGSCNKTTFLKLNQNFKKSARNYSISIGFRSDP